MNRFHVLCGARITDNKGHFGGTYLGMPAIDVLNAIRKGQHVTMRSIATVNVATLNHVQSLS